ncbi:succinate dehydrogenase assembly factor 4, mitochondrial isoform X1 [Rissa tridactyla]|uniref:succinate dehydrogenase assembly factor 4, mitochondrial isoform X1 n=1 Tax=Rissa tridactyla TaxID=75485 RepID=UPI0023BA5021|nr:succinate dehydrogenase assembly factor 4, mitochondrial isoform X1 [Rissa tridactyla]
MALRLLRGAPGAAKSSLLCSSLRSTSSKTRGRSEPAKQPLKKPKLPVGRFDEPEESSIEREPLEMSAVSREALQHFFSSERLSVPSSCSSQMINISNPLGYSIRVK